MALIEREAVKAKKVYSKERHEYVVPVAELDWLPTVETAPVVHGRWRWCGADRWNECYICSECGKMSMNDSGFCPNCGARMDGGEEHEAG